MGQEGRALPWLFRGFSVASLCVCVFLICGPPLEALITLNEEVRPLFASLSQQFLDKRANAPSKVTSETL